MYTEGLNLTPQDSETAFEGDSGVALRTNGPTHKDSMLQARSRYSMGPVLLDSLDEDTTTDAAYKQMYGTTGTFRD